MLSARWLILAALLISSLGASIGAAPSVAQVQQNGSVTNGHVAQWVTNNVVKDGGAATNGSLTNVGITSPNGCALGINTNAITSPYTQFCVGTVPNVAVQITDTALGGAAHIPITFIVNGNPSLSVTDAGVLVNGQPIVGNTIPNNTVLGNVTGSTAAPIAISAAQVDTMLGLGTAAFINTGTSGATIPLLSTANTWALGQTFGVNLATGGSLTLAGATSGNATIQVAAVAGTGTVFQLPATNGTSTYFLQTDGAGVTSWQPVSASVFTGILLGANGGTGVANTGKTITLGGNLTTSGAFATTLTVTGATALTLPTSGTVTALGNTVTGSGSIVLASSPALVTPALGVATATSLAIGGATIGSNGLAVTGHLLLESVTSTGATGTGNLVFSASPTFTGTAVAATLNATNLNGILGAGTPAAGTFTTVTANTSVTSPWYSATGAIPGYGTSTAYIDYAGGGVRIQSTGANGATMGTVTISQGVNNYATSRTLFDADTSGNISLGGASGAESLRVVPVASASIFLTITGSNGGNPTISTSSAGLSIGSGGGVTTVFTDSAPTLTNITTGTNADVLCVDAGKVIRLQAAASCTISSQRFKTDIHRAWSGLWDLLWLRPSFFKRIGQEENPDNNAIRTQLGLIAEDVAAVEPAATLYEQDGVTPKAYHDEAIIAMLVNGAQQQLAVDGVLLFGLVLLVGLAFRRRHLVA